MSDNNIVAEFNNLGVLAQKLEDTGRYDVGMLISGLKHLLTENNFFYGPLVDQAPVNDPSRVFFDLKVNPAVHQLVYVHLGGGYAKEMRGPHWCYVVKNNGQKLTIIPLTPSRRILAQPRSLLKWILMRATARKAVCILMRCAPLTRCASLRKRDTAKYSHQEKKSKLGSSII